MRKNKLTLSNQGKNCKEIRAKFHKPGPAGKSVCDMRNNKRDRECYIIVTKKNSVALVRKRTIPTERPPLVGEVNANFSG
jgi:hypothetical protein